MPYSVGKDESYPGGKMLLPRHVGVCQGDAPQQGEVAYILPAELLPIHPLFNLVRVKLGWCLGAD